MTNSTLKLNRSNDESIGNVASDNLGNESHGDRAKRLGINIHQGGRNKANRSNRGQAEVFENEYSKAQMSGNVAPTENVNIVEGNNSYIGDNNELDDLAIQKANQLSVSDQNPFVNEDPYAPAAMQGYDEPKPRKRGTGFLGRNTRKMKKSNSSHYA